MTLANISAGSPKRAQLVAGDRLGAELGDEPDQRLAGRESPRAAASSSAGVVAGDERLRARVGRDDERRLAAGQLGEQRRRDERQVAGDDDDRRLGDALERGDDPGQRVGGSAASSTTTSQSSGGSSRAGLGDDDRLEPGGARGGDRIGDQRPAGQLDGRLRAAHPPARARPPGSPLARALIAASLAAIGDDPGGAADRHRRRPLAGPRPGRPDRRRGRAAARGRGPAPGRGRVRSRVDVPGFDNSAMDGYAVRAPTPSAPAGDARASSPLVGESRAGHPAGRRARRRRGDRDLDRGDAARRAPTRSSGSRTPSGADGRGRRSGPPSDAGTNVRRAGEDIDAGDEMLAAGTLIGARRARRARRRRASRASPARAARGSRCCCTGDELVEPDRELAPGADPRLERLRGAAAGDRPPAPRSGRRGDRRRPRGDRGGDRAAALDADVAGRLRRRLGRRARPRPPGARVARGRAGLLGRLAAARQADLLRRRPRRGAPRLRPARQPGLGDGHVPALRAAGAAGDAGRRSRRAGADGAADDATTRRCAAAPRRSGSASRPARRLGDRRRPGRRARTC